MNQGKLIIYTSVVLLSISILTFKDIFHISPINYTNDVSETIFMILLNVVAIGLVNICVLTKVLHIANFFFIESILCTCLYTINQSTNSTNIFITLAYQLNFVLCIVILLFIMSLFVFKEYKLYYAEARDMINEVVTLTSLNIKMPNDVEIIINMAKHKLLQVTLYKSFAIATSYILLLLVDYSQDKIIQTIMIVLLMWITIYKKSFVNTTNQTVPCENDESVSSLIKKSSPQSKKSYKQTLAKIELKTTKLKSSVEASIEEKDDLIVKSKGNKMKDDDIDDLLIKDQDKVDISLTNTVNNKLDKNKVNVSSESTIDDLLDDETSQDEDELIESNSLKVQSNIASKDDMDGLLNHNQEDIDDLLNDMDQNEPLNETKSLSNDHLLDKELSHPDKSEEFINNESSLIKIQKKKRKKPKRIDFDL